MVLKSLSYVLLKVQQNKVALKFRFSQSNVDFFVLLYCSSKKPKNGGKHTFDKENENSEDTLTYQTLKVHYVKVPSEL